MNITRRYFMKSTGALAAYCGLAPTDVLAAEGAPVSPGELEQVTSGKTLVVVFLRGGMDGLNLVVPFQDSSYYELRRGIAIPRPGETNGALDLDGFFGLHPRAESLKPLFDTGSAVAMQAVGYDKNTRSHFEEQDVWETGVVGNTVNSDGWLNRHLLTSEGRGPVRAISIGDNLPRILRGKATAFAVRGLTDLTIPGKANEQQRMAAALEYAYCTEPRKYEEPARELLSQTGADTLDAMELLQKVAAQKYETKATYPDTALGKRLKEVARLIKADIGLEIAEVDYGGWDTHQNQGNPKDGTFANLVGTLSEALAAFHTDLEGRMDDVLVVTLSDFGRTAEVNGSGGTDHGWANCMLAMGGPITRKTQGSPSSVLGKWPGLGADELNQGRDLLHTTDFRNVLAEIVRGHLGNPHLETILPQHEFQPAGLIV